MTRYALPLTVLAAALALPLAAIADDPRAPYEGRPLPDLVKQLIWDKACDLPQAEAEADQCQGDRCDFLRSNGTRFKPQDAPWMDLTMFQWAAGANTLQPALVEGKLGSEDDIQGDARLGLALASGLAVDVITDDFLVQLNPLLVRWVARELLPPAERSMCGKTARELYQAAFQKPTRLMVDVYAQLEAKGAFRGTKLAELERNFNQQKGRFASMCKAIAKKGPTEESWPRTGSCWWWLRRAASGGTDELALLFGKALREYDPEASKTYAKALPKAPN